jgi:FG-GAP-like repeat
MKRLRRVITVALLLGAPLRAAETPFAPAQFVSGGGTQPRAVAVADLDRDGDADLVVALQSPPQVVVHRQLAAGSFDAPVAIGESVATPAVSRQLRLADPDDDGDTDVIATRADGTVCIARNAGDGSFANFACIANAIRSELADINRDGQLDLVTAGASTGVEWRAGDRNGAFGSPSAVDFQRSASGLAIADLDRDGRPDIARADDGSLNPGVSVHRNPASGSSWAAASVFDSAVSALALIDVDSDGDLDIAAGRCSLTGHVILRLNDGAANFSNASGIGIEALPGGQTPCPRVLAAVDLDRDGRTDLIEADSLGRVLFFHNAGGSFVLERSIADAQAGTASAAHDIAIADLDRDGDADVIAAHASENQLALSQNRSLRRGLRSGPFLSAAGSFAGAETLLSGDVDRDGRRDVIAASRSDNSVRLLRRTASGFAAAETLAAGVNAPRSGVIADMNRDGKPDLVLGSPGNSRVMQLLGDGTGGFAAATIAASGMLDTTAIVSVDLDRDGDLDLVVADAALGQLRWLRNSGNGSYASSNTITGALDGPCAIEVVDVDRDGWPDLGVALESGNRVIWLRNALRDPAAPDFTQLLLSDAPEIAAPRNLAFADADGDGLADVFINSSGGTQINWLRQVTPGSFGSAQALPALAAGNGIVRATDIDGDARVDLVYTLGALLTVRSDIIGNQGGGGYTSSSSQPRQAVAIDDLNADSMADIAEVSGAGSLLLRLTEPSNARARNAIITIPFARRRTDLRLASLTLSHDGRNGDDALLPRRIGFTFRRTNVNGALLSGTEYSQLFSQVRLFGDDGDEIYEPGIDPLLAGAAAAEFNAGVLSFTISASQTPLAFGTTARFHFVAQLSPRADSVTRVLHISAAAAGTQAVNAEYAALVDISADTFGTTLDLDVIFRSRFE